MEERKRRRNRQDFEERLFPWMCLVALMMVIVYVVLGLCVNGWLFLWIPLGIFGAFMGLFIVVGLGCALTSAIAQIRDFMQEGE